MNYDTWKTDAIADARDPEPECDRCGQPSPTVTRLWCEDLCPDCFAEHEDEVAPCDRCDGDFPPEELTRVFRRTLCRDCNDFETEMYR